MVWGQDLSSLETDPGSSTNFLKRKDMKFIFSGTNCACDQWEFH